MSRSIEKIVKIQREFYNTGATKKYDFRIKALERLANVLEDYEEELKSALKSDLNKSSYESYMAEIGLTKTELHYVKTHLRSWMRHRRVRTPLHQFPAESFMISEPYGIVLIMAPWNYPLLLCLEPLIDAIAAGNCVVLKPSAYAPAASSALRRMLRSIFPERFVAVIEGGREANSLLLEQRFDYIFFTGGVTVGRLVLEKAAKNLTPVTLELGGKSPCIVDKTADIKLAARRIAFGKLINAGQTCVAPDYLIVHEDVKEKLLNGLCGEIQRMLGSEPLDNPEYPRIINKKHFKRILELLEGENVVYGGAYREESLKIEPSIVEGVSLHSAIMNEEIFGPALPVLTYKTNEEINRIITSFEKPLAFYLFTQDSGMEKWALETFSFGGGCINDTIVHLASPYLPFGGVGRSGMGAYHGKAGFDTFSHKKSVMKRGRKPDISLRYHPYSFAKEKIIRLFMN